MCFKQANDIFNTCRKQANDNIQRLSVKSVLKKKKTNLTCETADLNLSGKPAFSKLFFQYKDRSR